jgi:hypothetical protein
VVDGNEPDAVDGGVDAARVRTPAAARPLVVAGGVEIEPARAPAAARPLVVVPAASALDVAAASPLGTLLGGIVIGRLLGGCVAGLFAGGSVLPPIGIAPLCA